MEVHEYQINSNFVFAHYLQVFSQNGGLKEGLKDANGMSLKSISSKSVILWRTSELFCEYIQASPNDLYVHLNNIYDHFNLDEELFLLALVIFYRYMCVARYVLNIKRDSELFYLFILCIIIAFKALLDCPIDSGAIARSLSLDSSRIFHNEMQIMVALDFTLFFKIGEITELGRVFPLEAFSLLSYCSCGEKSTEIPSVICAYEFIKSPSSSPLVRNAAVPSQVSSSVPLVNNSPVIISSSETSSPVSANSLSPNSVTPMNMNPDDFSLSSPSEAEKGLVGEPIQQPLQLQQQAQNTCSQQPQQQQQMVQTQQVHVQTYPSHQQQPQQQMYTPTLTTPLSSSSSSSSFSSSSSYLSYSYPTCGYAYLPQQMQAHGIAQAQTHPRPYLPAYAAYSYTCGGVPTAALAPYVTHGIMNSHSHGHYHDSHHNHSHSNHSNHSMSSSTFIGPTVSVHQSGVSVCQSSSSSSSPSLCAPVPASSSSSSCLYANATTGISTSAWGVNSNGYNL